MSRLPPRLLPALAVAAAALATMVTPPALAVTEHEKCADLANPADPAPLTDAAAVRRLQEMTLEYIAEYREVRRWTILNVVGQRRTRDNLIAAMAYAETGEYTGAVDLIDRVLQSQELDPASPNYGYFALMLGDRAGPGDEIWMLYGGSYLLVLLDRHGDRLPPALVDRMRTAVHAAATGASRIAPPLVQTAQTLFQAHLLFRAGELLEDAALLAAGDRIWSAFRDFTRESGIPELGSPNYAKIHIYLLGFIADYTRDPAVREQATEIRRLVWWSLSRHFHAPTLQLAGPFSRTLTDLMPYELSGVNPSIFRESGGRIPLAPAAVRPSGHSFLDVGNAEARLHAVLATLFRASWPRSWLGVALCPPVEHQFRERTISWPQPGRPTGSGFEQFTTFVTPRSSLGSRNRDWYGMSPETRDVVAYTGIDGRVGIFRYRIASGSLHLSRNVAVQNRRSVAAAVIADRWEPSRVPQGSFTLEWRASADRPPVLRGAPAPGEGFAVDWLGTTMNVRLAAHTPVAGGTPTVSVSRPDAETIRVTWTAPLPGETAADGTNPVPVVLAAFGLHLEDRSAEPPPATLDPVEVTAEPDGWHRLSWRSPDGLLESSFPIARDQVAVREWVNGEPIAPSPLAAPSLGPEDEPCRPGCNLAMPAADDPPRPDGAQPSSADPPGAARTAGSGPRLRVSARRHVSLREAIGRGVAARIACADRCLVHAQVLIGPAQARRLRLAAPREVALGSLRAQLAGGASRRSRIRLHRRFAGALRRAGGGVALLRVTTTDWAGDSRSRSVRFRIQRGRPGRAS